MIDFEGYFQSYLDFLPLILIVVSLYWTRMVGGPWVPSSMQVVNRMMEMAEVGPKNVDLSKADVVMCYLMPDALTKLEKKFKQELWPGSRVVSNRFAFPTFDQVQEDGNVRLYLVYPDGDE